MKRIKYSGCWLYIIARYFTHILPLTILFGQYKKIIDRAVINDDGQNGAIWC